MLVQDSKLAGALSLVLWCASGLAEAQSTLRSPVGRAVEARFPGYRLVGPSDFAPEYRRYFRDGRVGALIEGRFDYDTFRDFAAVLIATEHSTVAGAEGAVRRG